jgi:gluconolactonase
VGGQTVTRSIYYLASALLTTLLLASPGLAQQSSRLSEICDDCKIEKVANCGTGHFLEGPNFDKSGNLWVVGLNGGTILKVTPDGQCNVVKSGVAFPGGARMDQNGKLIITSRQGLLSYDTATNEITTIRQYYGTQVFRGLNDVVVDKAGGIFFTEPNGSNAARPNGRVFYLNPQRQGEVTLVGDFFSFPNGLVLSPDETFLYVSDFSLNRILAVPVDKGVFSPGRNTYVFAYLRGGTGPDGMLVDSQGNVYSAHYPAGEIVIHDRLGFEIGIIKMPPDAGLGTTNITFQNGYLYITEASRNEIWRVKTKIPPTN